MFQKFFTDTIMSRFIKNLLSKEILPLIDCVVDGDIVLKDCFYLYKGCIVKCIESGILGIYKEEKDLYPSDELYPSLMLFPLTGKKPAIVKIVAYYNELNMTRYSYKYQSTSHYYDSETHKYLGEYLRYLRDSKGLNLMPYYNCYNQTIIDNVYLQKPEEVDSNGYILRNTNIRSYELGMNNKYKVLAVPIKFGKTYTIALDCPSEVLLRSIIYGSSGMVRQSLSEEIYYSDELIDSYVYKHSTSFHHPFTYKVDTDNQLVYQRQKNLYLVIQVPVDNDSTLTVLEGDYTQIIDENQFRDYNLYKNLSLLQFNSKESYAFSDRLIEYLLWNVINPLDELSDNVEKTQKALYELDPIYKTLLVSKKSFYGVWDDEIKNAVLRLIQNSSSNTYFRDMDGYINKDVEKLFSRRVKS